MSTYPVARTGRRQFWFIVLGVGLSVGVASYLGFADIGSVCACRDGTFKDELRLPLEDKEALCARECEAQGGGHWLRDGRMSAEEIKAGAEAGRGAGLK
ncbi:hypothetical protein [Myxococcus sp. CA039A]|uniref:hypothetical protein n=1 Tax=Myxococcus sp. CA039A TaxID=2741737 RepID=UPI00157B1E06|nr:hypothetical protein [Myxococcus sp. CA039A]NTX57537.1 hypothetical protein [Myxococcus sp. CA039A]